MNTTSNPASATSATSVTTAADTPHLVTDLNLAQPDDFYEALIDMHRDLTDEQSQLVNAKLILLLGNQIGDLGVLREAMALARQGVTAAEVTSDAKPQP